MMDRSGLWGFQFNTDGDQETVHYDRLCPGSLGLTCVPLLGRLILALDSTILCELHSAAWHLVEALVLLKAN